MNNHSSRLFSPDYREQPFWWERTPRPVGAPTPLPASVDVLVIGSGYTGLCAALQTARGGRSTLVIDSAEPGWGCSSRNGGQVSTGIKPDYASLEKEFGRETALEVHRAGSNGCAVYRTAIGPGMMRRRSRGGHAKQHPFRDAVISRRRP